MKTVKISLNSIDKVKAFVNEISKFDCDFDLVSGRYVIDAKSIMGIFSLDLSKSIDLNIHADGSELENVLAVHIRSSFCKNAFSFFLVRNSTTERWRAVSPSACAVSSGGSR